MQNKKLTFQFAGLQGSYWMTYCAVYSFSAAFLLYKGFSNSEIGLLLGIANTLAVIIQPFIASMADKSKKISPREILFIFGFVSIIMALLILFIPMKMKTLGLIFLIENLSMILMQPLLNSFPFQYINAGVDIDYGFVRCMGSLFYGVASIFLGSVIDTFSPDILLPIQIVSFMIVLGFSYFIRPPKVTEKRTKEETGLPEDNSRSWGAFIKEYKSFIFFALGIMILFIANNCMGTYTLQIVQHLGGNETNFGVIIGVAAFAEMPIMLMFTKIIRKLRIDRVIKISIVFIALKVLLTLLAGSITFLMAIQLTQAIGYGLYIVAVSYYVNIIMKDGDKIKGQTLLTMASTSGGVVGSLIGGVLIDTVGVSYMLFVLLIIAIVGTVITVVYTEQVT